MWPLDSRLHCERTQYSFSGAWQILANELTFLWQTICSLRMAVWVSASWVAVGRELAWKINSSKWKDSSIMQLMDWSECFTPSRSRNFVCTSFDWIHLCVFAWDAFLRRLLSNCYNASIGDSFSDLLYLIWRIPKWRPLVFLPPFTKRIRQHCRLRMVAWLSFYYLYQIFIKIH